MRVGETLTFCLRHVCVKHQRPPSDDGSESRVLLECRAVADIPPWPELAFLSRIIGNPRGREPGFISSSFCDFDFAFEWLLNFSRRRVRIDTNPIEPDPKCRG